MRGLCAVIDAFLFSFSQKDGWKINVYMYACMNANIYLLSRANGSEVHYYDLVNLRESLTGNLEGCALSWFSSTVTVSGVMRRRYVILVLIANWGKRTRRFDVDSVYIHTLAGSINIGV